MLYHQSVHNNLKTRRERKHISNLIQFFHFSFFWSGHTIPIIIYSTSIFFAKRLPLFHFQHDIFFLTTFYSRQDLFLFWRKWTRHPFFQFFYSKWNTILLRKRNGMTNYFLYFFSKNSKCTFLFWQESIFWILMTS